MGLHHAGMLRSDRNLTERLFADGLIKAGRGLQRGGA
jgi:activating signal cointegrator complex subunit 3